MSSGSSASSKPVLPIPADDLQRNLTTARPDTDKNLPHIGVVGDTYTILLGGDDTAGRFCLIDMHVPPGGGPPPHRHDFEETFTLLEGQLDVTFRGQKSVVRAGETINVPANAPHQFHNSSATPVRMLIICQPASQEKVFAGRKMTLPEHTSRPQIRRSRAKRNFKVEDDDPGPGCSDRKRTTRLKIPVPPACLSAVHPNLQIQELTSRTQVRVHFALPAMGPH